MKNSFHELVSQFGKALAQELLKTKSHQVKLINIQQNQHPFSEEDYLKFIEAFGKYKNYSFEELRDIKCLTLQDKSIENISPLRNLIYLEKMDICKNMVKDISPLRNLNNLEKLWLFENKISNLFPLRNLSNLKELLLHCNEITDLSELSNLTELKILTLSKNNITDISPLKNLIYLEELVLSDNPISNQQIEKMKKSLPNCKIAY